MAQPLLVADPSDLGSYDLVSAVDYLKDLFMLVCWHQACQRVTFESASFESESSYIFLGCG